MSLLSRIQQVERQALAIPTNPVLEQGSERSFGDTEAGADHSEDPEDC